MTASERLKQARIKRGYPTAQAAIDAFGWKAATYFGHENGHRAFDAATAQKYASALGVEAQWLLFGDGGFEESPVERLQGSNSSGHSAHFIMRAPPMFSEARSSDIWRVTETIYGFGMLDGDVLVVDLAATPDNGDIVILNEVDSIGRARTLIRRVTPHGYLSGDPMAADAVAPLDDQRLAVLGVVVGMIRERRSAMRHA